MAVNKTDTVYSLSELLFWWREADSHKHVRFLVGTCAVRRIKQVRAEGQASTCILVVRVCALSFPGRRP